MSRETHVQFCEGLGVQFPGATHRLVHCRREQEAQALKAELQARLAECHLEMHPTKTKIVYCRDGKQRGIRARQFLQRLATEHRALFLHWALGTTGVFASWEPRMR